MHILVISGPNLNLLGRREPAVYGLVTLEQIHSHLKGEAEGLGCTLECFQSNHEGALIDFLQGRMDGADGALLNPGGLTHTSVSLHDAVKSMPFPVIEVHLSHLHQREEWRQRSVIAPATQAQVMGFGWLSYLVALHGLVRMLRRETPAG